MLSIPGFIALSGIGLLLLSGSLGCDGGDTSLDPTVIAVGDSHNVFAGPDSSTEQGESDVSGPSGSSDVGTPLPTNPGTGLFELGIEKITMERQFPMIEEPHDRLTITIDVNGVVVIDQPPGFVHEGTHQFMYTADMIGGLSLGDLLDNLPEDSEALDGRIRERSDEDLKRYTDASFTSLRILMSDGTTHEAWARGVEFWAEQYPDEVELVALADVDKVLWEMMVELTHKSEIPR
ncbi:MAG: hypothetical protein ACNA8W_23330 [Bradymonadaceae bacterium]